MKFLADAECDLSTARAEVKVASLRHGYAGKLDLVAVVFGERMLIDYKSGGLGAVRPQTAGYDIAYREGAGIARPLPRVALQLKPDGTYKFKQLLDFGDYLTWIECVEKYKGKESNG